MSRLSLQLKLNIIKRHEEGATKMQLSEEFDVSTQAVGKILKKKESH